MKRVYWSILVLAVFGFLASDYLARIKPEKTIIGKWREIGKSCGEIIVFNKNGDFILSNNKSCAGVIPRGGDIYKYHFIEEDIVAITSALGSISKVVGFPSKDLHYYKKVDGDMDFYSRIEKESENAYKGAYLFHNEKYSSALALLESAAKAGEVDSQYYLAVMYLKGEGVEKDLDVCLKWAKKSADSGYYPALGILGIAYAVKKNYKAAAESYEKALSLGVLENYHKVTLAMIYATGPKEVRNGIRALKIIDDPDFRFDGSDEEKFLASIYAATGNFEKAVQYQSRFADTKMLSARYSSDKEKRRTALEEKILLDKFYAKNLAYPYDDEITRLTDEYIAEAENENKLKKEKQERENKAAQEKYLKEKAEKESQMKAEAEAQKKAAEEKTRLTKESVLETKVLGKFTFTREDSRFSYKYEIKITDVGMEILTNEYLKSKKKWSSPRQNKKLFKDIRKIGVLNLAHAHPFALVINREVTLRLSDKDGIIGLGQSLKSAVIDWREKYASIAGGKLIIEGLISEDTPAVEVKKPLMHQDAIVTTSGNVEYNGITRQIQVELIRLGGGDLKSMLT